MSTPSLNIGQEPKETGIRDAIHIAVISVVAGEDLYPGYDVGLTENEQAVSSSMVFKVGIVDPFRHNSVKTGERFWLFLYYGSLTSLRHDWEHPAFPKQKKELPASPVAEDEYPDECAHCD